MQDIPELGEGLQTEKEEALIPGFLKEGKVGKILRGGGSKEKATLVGRGMSQVHTGEEVVLIMISMFLAFCMFWCADLFSRKGPTA